MSWLLLEKSHNQVFMCFYDVIGVTNGTTFSPFRPRYACYFSLTLTWPNSYNIIARFLITVFRQSSYASFFRQQMFVLSQKKNMNCHFSIYEIIIVFPQLVCRLSYVMCKNLCRWKINSCSDPTLTQVTRRSLAWIESRNKLTSHQANLLFIELFT